MVSSTVHEAHAESMGLAGIEKRRFAKIDFEIARILLDPVDQVRPFYEGGSVGPGVIESKAHLNEQRLTAV